MRPAPFTYLRPRSLQAALQATAAGATPIAGGQTLIQSMRLRRLTPTEVVDLADVLELSASITVEGDMLRIGARVTHVALINSPLVTRLAPWLVEAALQIADVQVRNRGTTVGNLCWADPRANMAVAMLASDAVVVAADASGTTSRIPLRDFFAGFQLTTLAGRIATAVDVPVAAADRIGAYIEQSRQRQDLAVVNVCVVAGAGYRPVRIAVGGIHQTPVRLIAAEQAVEASGSPAAALDAMLEALRTSGFAPPGDIHASEGYRLHLAKHLVEQALQRCGNGPHA